jgi:hypothetical protein
MGSYIRISAYTRFYRASYFELARQIGVIHNIGERNGSLRQKNKEQKDCQGKTKHQTENQDSVGKEKHGHEKKKRGADEADKKPKDLFEMAKTKRKSATPMEKISAVCIKSEPSKKKSSIFRLDVLKNLTRKG